MQKTATQRGSTRSSRPSRRIWTKRSYSIGKATGSRIRKSHSISLKYCESSSRQHLSRKLRRGRRERKETHFLHQELRDVRIGQHRIDLTQRFTPHCGNVRRRNGEVESQSDGGTRAAVLIEGERFGEDSREGGGEFHVGGFDVAMEGESQLG
jgi:hypothetical protein